MCELTSISERRACRLAGLSRDAFRHEPVPTLDTQRLSARLVELAQVRRRFGYRRLHDLLNTEFPNVNHKRIYRLYREAKLGVRRRRKTKRLVGERQKLVAAAMPNDTWSMDFVFDALANGRRIKTLTVVDDFTRESVDIAVDHGISGEYVTRLLDQAACFRGYPSAVRTDNVLTLESTTNWERTDPRTSLTSGQASRTAICTKSRGLPRLQGLLV